jgi:transcriptional repressor NrdR
MERIEVRLPLVVKKDGTREPFDQAKLRTGVAIACRKRPVSAEAVEGVVREVVEQLTGRGAEVTTEEVGMTVLEALRSVDLVAYVRFASVYREVQGPRDFIALLEPWMAEVQ